MIDQVFSDWNETHSRDYGKKLVHIHHRLHQSPLFTDAAIERLIETLSARTLRPSYHGPRSP